MASSLNVLVNFVKGEIQMKAFCFLLTIAMLAAAPILVWSEENGAALYDSKCSMCHGDKGEGNPPGGIPKSQERP